MTAVLAPEKPTAAPTVSLTIDGRAVSVPAGATVWDAARSAGIDIPVLCHDPRLTPVGVCRMCVVDTGGRVMAAACVRPVEPGMKVDTCSEKVQRQRKMLTALLMSDHPTPCARERTTADCKLEELARKYEVSPNAEFGIRNSESKSAADPTASVRNPDSAFRIPHSELRIRPTDLSSPVIAVDHQACILCDRCVRGCDEIQHNDIIGRTGKGYTARIGFDLDQPMGESRCVSCGECAAVCPTGALTNKALTAPIRPRHELKAVDSVCPYCGVGCALTYYVDEKRNAVAYADGRESRVNHFRLCVKGRYGFDYTSHPQRLTMPLIRRSEAYPKGALSVDVRGENDGKGRKPGGVVDYAQVMPAFREASWDEALDLVAGKLKAIRDTHGPGTLAGFGSAKCSNEEAYLFQKLIRAGFGTNNVDHCTRLCHASSVAALMETIGSGAVTNIFADIERAEVALLAGTNTTSNHPVAASFFKQAAARGTKLIVVDPRRPDVADYAGHFVRIKPGTDVAFYNGMMNVLIAEGMIDGAYVEAHTEGFEQLKAVVAKYTPQVASDICGASPDLIREVARVFGRSKASIIFWGMGISQHIHGTDNARCLISLCLLTGNVGRPGTGLHPLRGQNNVQGASDAGLIPMVFPDYQPVGKPEVRAKFEKAWGRALDPKPGLTVVEIAKAALEGKIKGLYIMGENPFLSDPNINKVRKALANLEFMAVQDIFLTETAEFADVILPATTALEKTGTYTNTDRRVQIGRPALLPPGQARLDWKIICDISNRMGYPMNYNSVEEVFAEFTALSDSYHGLTYEHLAGGGRLWPCHDPAHQDGEQVLFGDRFPTGSGRGKFVGVEWTPAAETPDAEYPFVLNTGRLLEHWHTGTMTRRAQALDAIEPEATVEMHPDDLRRLSINDGDMATISSRRGRITLRVRAGTAVSPGGVFIPFHFREAAANVLTIDRLDPYGKIPEFKFCAVKVEKGAAP